MPTTLPAFLLASCFRTKGSEGTLQGVEPGQTYQTVTYLPGIFPLHLQDLPDGLPTLATVYLEPQIRELSLTPAHTEADPDRAEL